MGSHPGSRSTFPRRDRHRRSPSRTLALAPWAREGIGLPGMSPVSDPDELYGLALEEFVSERDALAKRLRSAGDRAGAEEVKRLAKPSRAAWAVNQLMRSQPRARRS